jgi:hypothetical protein
MTGLLHPSDEQYEPAAYFARHAMLDAPRPSPLDWVRQRRADREQRRVEAAHQKAAQRMESLGRDWRVLDLQSTGGKPMSFLALGPGGIFAVTVKDHGRSKVSFAGDVVQIDGRRPRYVAEARENAELAARTLSRVAGVSIPVLPVLAFAGNGVITVYGMPKGCIVTSYRELPRVLDARGKRLATTTVEKLYALATHPTTWVNPPYVPLAERYRWHPQDGAATERQAG